MMTKQITDSFFADSKKRIIKFFKNPCFTCCNHYVEHDDSEYSTGSWSGCEKYDEHTQIEKHSNKKAFPMCEAPKICLKKKLYQFIHNYDDFDIFDSIGMDIWGRLMDIDFDAPSIAGRLSRFYRAQGIRRTK